MEEIGKYHACKAKVGNLNSRVCARDENVGGLEVSVNNIGRVDVLEATQNLVQDVLYVSKGHELCLVLNDSSQVRVHVFKHQVDVSLSHSLDGMQRE